ncbi:cytochrome c [Pararhodobacter sp. CCB-MM2]|uniref:c-type cytochrome n=1 Tax=Pararhodobacter sp. CCB-MM2 TaxID=1786003 RepID=UPI00082A5F5C|nr:cytochrome c [Pararhodobacter sp. CCB-MM2]
MRTFLRIIGVLVVIAVVAFLAFLFIPVQRTPAQAALPDSWTPEEGQGEYAMRLGDCMACHTAPGGEPFAGGREIESPLGVIYASNITPDNQTGIGGWSLDDFRAALYDGVGPDGTHLYPAMPYENFGRISEEDVRAMYDYFMNDVPPVDNAVSETALSFPFNQRWGLRAWNWVALSDAAGFTAESTDPELSRGEYIVEGPGHCGACHSPRNAIMAEAALDGSDPQFLAGGEIAGWTAPALRGPNSAIRGWSADEVAAIMGTGRNAHSAVNGEMQLVVQDSSQYFTDEDLQAVGAYLVSLNDDGPAPEVTDDGATEALLASADPSMALGARLYLDNCNACHFANGQGADEVFPALAGNSLVTAAQPTGLISMILNGSELPSTAARPYRLRMPGFAARLSDDEVAALASFVRQGWGNAAAPVEAGSVADLRDQGDAATH